MAITSDQIRAVATHFGGSTDQPEEQQPTKQPTKKRKKVTEETKTGKKLISVYLTVDNYKILQEYARYLANNGETNDLNQRLGAGTLIDEAIQEYINRHMKEIEEWREYMKSAPKPPKSRRPRKQK